MADVALCLLLEPYGAHTEIVWADYRLAHDLDTVVVGASAAAYDIDPRVLDRDLGTTSFNMGTPGQSLDNSFASLEEAACDHTLTRAILCLGYETMAGVPYINSSTVFTQAKCLGESPAKAMRDVARLVFTDYYFPKVYSLSCAFPWTYDHVDYTLDAVSANVANRLQGDVHVACKNYGIMTDSNWRYEAQGYGGVHTARSPHSAHGVPAAHNKDQDFFEGNVESVRQICAYCQKNGISLYVLACPYTPTTILEYGEDYWRNMAALQAIATEADAHYFDLNMLHRDLFDPRLPSYCDNVHLSASGARQAGSVVSSLIKRVEKGEDVSDLFYAYSKTGWAAYRDALDFVDSIDFTYIIDDNGNARITSEARTGSTTPVEYQYETYDSDARRWVTAQDFTTDSTFTLQRTDVPIVKIRITARATNGRQDADRTVQGDVYFE